MGTARSWGVPLSILRGRPHPQPGEPWFTDDDRDLALALAELESQACPGCGRPWHETTNPMNEGDYRAEAVRCHGCTAIARARDGFDDPEGLYTQMTRIPEPRKDDDG